MLLAGGRPDRMELSAAMSAVFPVDDAASGHRVRCPDVMGSSSGPDLGVLFAVLQPLRDDLGVFHDQRKTVRHSVRSRMD